MENSIYFTQVKVYLSQLTVDEQEDVIRFYQEYVADAQLSGERLISELGTPKQLARRILVDYSLRLEEDDIHHTYEHESNRQDRQNWIKQEFNLISIVLEGLLTSVVWVPAMLLILICLFATIGIAAIVIVALIYYLLTGLFQIVGGLAILPSNWATGLYQGGIGLIIVGLQFVAWPVGVTIIRTVFRALMRFVKYVGRRFSHKGKEVTHHA
ncbi:DUF1700 domain-containing protein [Weissella paramesenteroides]|uniref:DUF1700 domain-containing protein n=1 Tax=Weissella paramesenteroides TaxID=1249 RepID=UPI0038578722